MTIIRRRPEFDAQVIQLIAANTVTGTSGLRSARMQAVISQMPCPRDRAIRYLAAMAREQLIYSMRAAADDSVSICHYFTTAADLKAFATAYAPMATARKAERARVNAAKAYALNKDARNAAARQRRADERAARKDQIKAQREARIARGLARRAAEEQERIQRRAGRDAAAKARADERAAKRATEAAKARAEKAAKVAATKAAAKAKPGRLPVGARPGKPGRLPVGARPGKRDQLPWHPTAPVASSKPQCKVDPVIPAGLEKEVAPTYSDYKHQVTEPVVGGLKTAGIGRYLEPASGWVAAALRQAANDGQGRAAA